MSADTDERLHKAVHGLYDRSPNLSASTVLVPRQREWLIAGLVVLIVFFVLWPHPMLVAVVSFTTFVYVGTLAFRVSLMWHAARHPGTAFVSDREAMAVDPAALPPYTVLIPCYKEPEVMGRLLEGVGKLSYPREKLDVKLLLEADDDVTISAAKAAGADRICEILVVPAANPRTKPKALNYGLQTSTGELVTVYDAEDRPDPLQLRKAAIALARSPDTVACLQAELAYFNDDQNLITRWFSLEYGLWFRQFLPGLSRVSAPIPLGGTSNHFRREVLEKIGGWDPYNVTEDADLGVRLHRNGYTTGMLASETLEEANSDLINWVKQRSRWYKGYLQTWLVHMRNPIQMAREVGLPGFIRFNLFVGGTPLLALVNPIFWFLTIIWFVAEPNFILHLFPAGIYYTGLATWIFGNFLFAYSFMYAGYETAKRRVFWAGVLAPLYWIAMSMAAYKAMLQLIFTPQYWEKTQHGLDHAGTEAEAAA
jgi:cellulose synthase/poly-beta-1,6-N-acetylglucosamine synthase-like glycosyltransferase